MPARETRDRATAEQRNQRPSPMKHDVENPSMYVTKFVDIDVDFDGDGRFLTGAAGVSRRGRPLRHQIDEARLDTRGEEGGGTLRGTCREIGDTKSRHVREQILRLQQRAAGVTKGKTKTNNPFGNLVIWIIATGREFNVFQYLLLD